MDPKAADNVQSGGGAGWLPTDDPGLLRACLEHPEPPRPLGYGRQLLVDATSGRSLLYWGLWAGPAALGLAIGWLFTVAWGVFVLVTYVRVLVGAVRFSRRCPLDVGVIRALRPLSWLRGASMVGALVPDGTVVDVHAATGPTRRMLVKHRRVEVLFLHDREAKAAWLVGMRPVATQPEQSV